MKNQSELNTGYTTNSMSEDSVFFNLKTDPYPRLISFQDLLQSHKESFLSHYGLPHTDMIMDDKTFQEKDTLLNISAIVSEHRKNDHIERPHNLERYCQLLNEIPLLKIMSLVKNENKTCLQQHLAVLHANYRAFRHKLGIRSLSRSQFCEVLQQRLEYHGQSV